MAPPGNLWVPEGVRSERSRVFVRDLDIPRFGEACLILRSNCEADRDNALPRRVEAAGSVDAQNAHKILGKPRENGFPQATTRLHPVSCSKTTGTRSAQIAQNSPTDFPEEAKAKDEADALAIANDTQFGLSASVVTRDIDRGKRFALAIQSGMGHVNDISVADSEYAAYGGERNSGIGRFNAEWVIEEFTRPHWITTQRETVVWPF